MWSTCRCVSFATLLCCSSISTAASGASQLSRAMRRTMSGCQPHSGSWHVQPSRLSASSLTTRQFESYPRFVEVPRRLSMSRLRCWLQSSHRPVTARPHLQIRFGRLGIQSLAGRLRCRARCRIAPGYVRMWPPTPNDAACQRICGDRWVGTGSRPGFGKALDLLPTSRGSCSRVSRIPGRPAVRPLDVGVRTGATPAQRVAPLRRNMQGLFCLLDGTFRRGCRFGHNCSDARQGLALRGNHRGDLVDELLVDLAGSDLILQFGDFDL